MISIMRMYALPLAVFLACGAYAEEPVSAKGRTALTQFGGRVEVSRGGGAADVVSKIPVLLDIGDRVSTAGGTAVVTFSDGSEVRLEPQTQASIGSDSAAFMLIRLSAGKLWAKVTKLGGRRFEVRTPNAVAAVRGTEFSMAVTGLFASRTSVQEGRVSVRALVDDRPIGAERLIGAGESVNIVGKQASLDGAMQSQITAPPKAAEQIAANSDVSRLGSTPAAIRATFARETSAQLRQDAVQRAAAGASASPQAQESSATMSNSTPRNPGRKGDGGKGGDGIDGGKGGDSTDISEIRALGDSSMGTVGTSLKTGDDAKEAASDADSKTGLPTDTDYSSICPECPKLQ